MKFAGATCWSVLLGKNTGSAVDMKFGDKLPRIRPLNNPHLSSDERKYDGEMSLYIIGCVWRIDSDEEVISVSHEKIETGSPSYEVFKSFIGHTLDNISLAVPGLDASFRFSNGLTLKLFCDRTGPKEPGNDNYCIFVQKDIYCVDAGSRLSHEVRRSI